MLVTDMFQSPEVGVYTPRTDVKRQFPLVRYASKTVFELMDIFLPETGEGPFPAVIDLHGGGYFYGSRCSVRMEPVLELIHHGYVVVSLDYTLSPYGKFPLQIHELKAAIRFLRANAEKYRTDPNRIAVWGLSAGAHIGTLAAVSTHVPELDDPSMGNASFSSEIQAVVDLYGPVDFTIDDITGDENPAETMYAIFLGSPLALVPDLVRLSNPCNFITPEMPPILIQHGDRDRLVNVKNSILLYDAICRVTGGKNAVLEIIPGADHADPLFRTEENNRKIYDFLDRTLKAKAFG